jgi:hypothetical protein
MEMAYVLKSVFNHVNVARISLRIAIHAQFFLARSHHRMVSNVLCLVSMRVSLQHSFSSDGLQTLNSHCDMYTITKTIAEVTACTGHKQVKKKRLGLLLYSRKHAGATRNLEADLTTCDRKVRAIKTLMSGA